MSNERIDLTQFEGIEDRIKHCQQGIYPAEDLLQELALMAPNLLAELKRCYEHIDTLTAIWCNTCEKQFGKSDYGIKYHRITVPDDSLLYEYREDMQEHCIECMETSEAIEKNCICDLCQQYHE